MLILITYLQSLWCELFKELEEVLGVCTKSLLLSARYTKILLFYEGVVVRNKGRS